MNQKIIITIVILAVVVIGGYFLYQSSNSIPAAQVPNQEINNTTQENTTSQNTTDNGIGVEVAIGKTYEVLYADSGYSPSPLTIKVGDTVTFKNQSSHGMWVASAMHPTHVVYSGTSLQEHCPDTANTAFDECKSVQSGQSWSFTFTKQGTWGYHNHVKASDFGKVIVE